MSAARKAVQTLATKRKMIPCSVSSLLSGLGERQLWRTEDCNAGQIEVDHGVPTDLVLEIALPTLVADRAVQRVVYLQQIK